MYLSPKFATGWYTTPPVSQLRQEFLHLYQFFNGTDIVREIDSDYVVDSEADWGAHLLAVSPLTVSLPPNALNGREVTVANHSGGTVSFVAQTGASIVSKGNLVGVDTDSAVGAIAGDDNTWYLYGALV